MEEPGSGAGGPAQGAARAHREARAKNWGSAWKKKSSAFHDAMREARRQAAAKSGEAEEEACAAPAVVVKPKTFFEAGFDGLVLCPCCMKKWPQDEAGEHLATCAAAKANRPKLVKEELKLELPAGLDLGAEVDDPPARMRIRSVEPDGWADQEGLGRGDEILTVHGKRVADMDSAELESLLSDEMIRPLRIKIVRRRRAKPAVQEPVQARRPELRAAEPEEEEQDDRVPCPHCARRFAADGEALERHVKICLKVFAGKKKIDTAKKAPVQAEKREEEEKPKKKPKRIDCWQTSTRELPPITPTDEDALTRQASPPSRSTAKRRTPVSEDGRPPCGPCPDRREKEVVCESRRPLNFEISRERGRVVVGFVEPGSWGQVQGLRAGDELVEVNGTPLDGLGMEDVADALQERPLELRLLGEPRKARPKREEEPLEKTRGRDESLSRSSRREDGKERASSRAKDRGEDATKDRGKPKNFASGLRGGDETGGVDYKARCSYLENQLKDLEKAKRSELDDGRRQLQLLEKEHAKELNEERRVRRGIEKQLASLRAGSADRAVKRPVPAKPSTGTADAFAAVLQSGRSDPPSDRKPPPDPPTVKREPPPDVRRRPPKAGGYAGTSPRDAKDKAAAVRRGSAGGRKARDEAPDDIADLKAALEEERRERIELAARTRDELLAERKHRKTLEGLLEERSEARLRKTSSRLRQV